MKRITRALLVAGIAAGAVVGGVSTAAFADSFVHIGSVATPNNYGYLTTDLDWNSNHYAFSFVNGSVNDTANDGHGPYLHVWANYGAGFTREVSGCNVHATGGPGTSLSTVYCGEAEGDQLTSINVWMCNGGTAAGTGAVEGGCYGRRAWSQVVYPGRTSDPLGTTYSPYGGQ